MNQSTPCTVFTIPEARLFHLTGRDASRYLHARLSNNVRDLALQRGCAAAGLSPQGRTEIFGTALKFSAEEFYFICDGGQLEEVTSSLLRYKVADRLECALLKEQLLAHIAPAYSLIDVDRAFEPLKDLPEFAPLRIGNLIAFKHQRSAEIGIDIFGPTVEIQSLIAQLTAAGAVTPDTNALLLGRIKAHRPAFPGELNDHAIFLESGLTHAVSFTKGCYVGQEVLEKVDSHGRLPYSLVSIASNTAVGSAPAVESAVMKGASEQTPVGEVVSVAIDNETGQAFCFARIKTGVLLPENLFTILDQEYRLL